MKLAQICIDRPVLATMMNLVLVLFGLVSMRTLPVRELPDVDPPIVTVTTVYPGASASVVESEVTERLEEIINSVQGIKNLRSESREQLSTITVEFNLSRPIDIAAQDVRDRVSRVRGVLPDDIEEPIVAKQDADARPVLWISLFGEKYTTLELTTLVERSLKDRFQTVPGVSSVVIGGEKRFAIRLWLDPVRMAAQGLTVLDVERALREQNVELPSGRVEGLERELAIETSSEMKSAEEFNKLVMKSDGRSLVRLEDIGRASVGVEDERAIARYNSQPAVGIGIVRQAKANTIEVANAVKAELERVRPTLPPGVNAVVAYDESVYIDKAIDEVWVTLAIAFVLVMATIFIFLGDTRSTIIPSISIPVSTVATFLVLSWMGYSVNILTMLALVLAIGIVVDDSIVVLENIFRHIEEGMSPLQAARVAMQEISFAVIAITLSLVAVFFPLTFLTSITGRLFSEFAVALCGAVIISAFMALTLTPTLAARVLKAKGASHAAPPSPIFARLECWLKRTTESYYHWLQWSLNHRARVVAGGVLSIVLSALFFSRLDKEFLPAEDKGRLFNIIIAPEGATAEYTDRMLQKIEAIARDVPEVKGYFSAVALNRGGPGRSNEGLMFVRLKEERTRGITDIVGGPHGLGARFFREVEGAFAIPILPKAIDSGFSQPFQLVLQHPDLESLNAMSTTLTQQLQREGLITNARSSFELNKPQISIIVNRDRAAILEISIRDIARTLQVLFGGLDLSTISLNGKEYEVIAQLERSARLTPQDLERLYVPSKRGTLVQLSNLVSTREFAGPNSISHYNRMRSTIIEGTPAGIPLGTAVARTEEILAGTLTEGFSHSWTGDAESLQDTGRDILFILIISVVVVYMVLAAQFESLAHPFTVMLALPLAGVGAFGLLWILSLVDAAGTAMFGWAHYAPNPPFIAAIFSALIPRIPAMTINLFSLIGVVLLVGLVTKNSILLVEFANQRLKEGASAAEAMLDAGRIRLRPILMTAFSTIAGILPIAIGFGAGAESRRPMGVAAVGGLVTSTFLTLFVVPVIYTLLDELRRRVRQKGNPGE